jgi:hypothetical protein
MITVTTREDFLKEVKKNISDNSVCVELGVLDGDFSKMILDILQPNCLVLVDPFVTNDDKKYEDGLPTIYSTEIQYFKLLKRFENEPRVVMYRNLSYWVVNSFTDGYYNFLYHDASHLYEDLKRDLNEWLPKLKNGGIIAGHDYIEFINFGVIEAVNEFCEQHNFEMIIFNENGGDWALKRN